MSFCSNCGKELADGVRFCPACGAAVAHAAARAAEEAAAEVSEAVCDTAPTLEGSACEAEKAVNEAIPAAQPSAEPSAEPAGKPKKKSRAGLIIGIVALALLAALAALYFTGAYKNLLPASRLKLGLAEKSMVDAGLDMAFSGRDKAADTKADTRITVSLGAENASIFSETAIINAILEKVTLDLNVDMDKEGSRVFAQVNYQGNPALDGRVIIEDGRIGLYVPQLDEKYYLFDAKTLAEVMSSSEDAAPADKSSAKTERLDEAKVRREVNDLLKILAGLSTKSNTVIERRADVPVFGGDRTVKADLYTITPSAEEFEAVFNALADYLDRDGCYIGGLINDKLMPAVSDEEGPATIGAKIREGAHENAVDLAEHKAKIAVAMIGNEIVSQRLVRDDGSAGYDIMNERSNTRVYAFMNTEDGSMSADTVLDKKDPDRIAGKSTITTADGETVDVKFDLDKTKTSALHTMAGNITVMYGGAKVVDIAVTPEGGAMKHVIVVASPDLGDVSSVTVTALVSEGSGVEAPKSVEPTDMTNASVEEIQAVFQNMAEGLSNILQQLLFGGLF